MKRNPETKTIPQVFLSSVVPTMVMLLILSAFIAGSVHAASYCHYPGNPPAAGDCGITWPTDAQWISVDTRTERSDATSSGAIYNLVGNTANPGIYYYKNGSYFFVRIRLFYNGTVNSSTFSGGTYWVYLNTDADATPDFALAFDVQNYFTNNNKHGLEMQIFSTGTTWGTTAMNDTDGTNASKSTGGIAPDIDASGTWPIGEGFIRTVDQVPCSTGTDSVCDSGHNYHTFLDFAVKCSYFARDTDLPALCTTGGVGLLAGVINNANDHSALGTGGGTSDISSGLSLTGTYTSGDWGIPTHALVNFFAAYNDNGKTVVQWITGAEAMTAGFNLYRTAPDGSRAIKVNENIIPALLESPKGGVYRVVDPSAASYGALTYVLEEIEMNGSKRNHGPYTVSASRENYTSDPRLFDYHSRMPAEAKSTGRILQKNIKSVRDIQPGTWNFLKIGITEPGLYRINASDIAAVMGLSTHSAIQMIRNNHFALTNRGQSIAAQPAPDFNALYFYGEGFDSIYTNKNIYLLSKGRPFLMGSISSIPGKGSAAFAFSDSKHIEENQLPATAIFTVPEADYWLWDYVSAADSNIGEKSFVFNIPGVVRGNTLTANLNSLTKSGFSNEHQVSVICNGTDLGKSAAWSGLGAHSVSFSLPSWALVEGINNVQVKAVLNPGIPMSTIGIDSFDVTYEHRYRAFRDYLFFTGNGNQDVLIDGFSSPNIWVLDLKDSRKPALLQGVKTGGTSGSAWIRMSSAFPDRKYLAVNLTAAKTPSYISPYPMADLSKRVSGADYIVITSSQLKSAALELAAYRASQKLKTIVVTTEEIYDEFAGGYSTPVAIQYFIRHAVEKWRPAPRFVVLAGEGSYDYRDILGNNDSIVPPIMVKTPTGAAPSDVSHVLTKSGDGILPVAIGRIPVSTSAELRNYTAKLKQYESSSGAWKNKVILVADNPDQGGDFRSASDAIASEMTSFSREKIYMPDLTADAARNKLIYGIRSGAFAVNYLGHAGYDYLAHERILSKADVATLANAGSLPIFLAMTCHVGQYGLPGRDTLGEALVKADAGAIAVWAPSTAVMQFESNALNMYFWRQLSYYETLGEAVNASLRNFIANGGSLYAPLSYNLLGDPAIRIAK